MRKTHKNRKLVVFSLLLLLISVGGILLESCDPCKCTEPEKFYAMNKADIAVLRKSADPNAHELLHDSGSVKTSELDIRLRFYFNYHSQICPPAFSLIQSANACSCLDPGYMGSDEPMLDLTIESMNKWNSTFGPGDTINSVVKVGGMEITDFIAAWNKSRDQNYIPTHELAFSQPADTGTWQKLRVTVRFGSQSHSSESKTFRILP